MFANLIVDSCVLGYRYNERESVAAFAVLEKVAGFAEVLIQAVRNLPGRLGGIVRAARA